MIGTTIGVTYPGLYAAVTHAVIAPTDPASGASPPGDWVVDEHRCVRFDVVGVPWTEPTTWLMLNTILPPCLTFGSPPAQICGTPMRVSTTTVTLRATDATGRVLTFTYTLTVRPTP